MDNENIVLPEELPAEAKKIFKETYMKVSEGFSSLEHVKGIVDEKKRRESASEIAWMEVKKKFRKEGNSWVKKE